MVAEGKLKRKWVFSFVDLWFEIMDFSILYLYHECVVFSIKGWHMEAVCVCLFCVHFEFIPSRNIIFLQLFCTWNKIWLSETGISSNKQICSHNRDMKNIPHLNMGFLARSLYHSNVEDKIKECNYTTHKYLQKILTDWDAWRKWEEW